MVAGDGGDGVGDSENGVVEMVEMELVEMTHHSLVGWSYYPK